MALVKVLMFVAFFSVFYAETNGCFTDSDCDGSLVCCSYNCFDSCVNQSCILNSNCGGDSDIYCCNDICRRESCVGYDCGSDIDCGGPNEYCCYGTCQIGTCLAAWAIAFIVIGALCFAAIIIGIALCYCCSYRHRSPGLIVAAPRTAVVAGSNVNYGSVYPQASAPPPPYYYQPTQTQK
ncbi:cysteine and tyrosine-rich 1 [Paramuricea clavata]|uniref:Cysteine and tyrosine-rich 1 n=1 Tax=Paramuricea clavata TaxID=317549 RepID=A0A6S7JN87_PARCT|nr:cysteine and tyrosine-rich 1 [Paramuricea clavata]